MFTCILAYLWHFFILFLVARFCCLFIYFVDDLLRRLRFCFLWLSFFKFAFLLWSRFASIRLRRLLNLCDFCRSLFSIEARFSSFIMLFRCVFFLLYLWLSSLRLFCRFDSVNDTYLSISELRSRFISHIVLITTSSHSTVVLDKY